MCNEKVIRRFAGTFVLISVVLASVVHPYWCFFTAFVGLNLLQSSFSDFCPLEKLLGRLNLFGCARPRPAGSR